MRKVFVSAISLIILIMASATVDAAQYRMVDLGLCNSFGYAVDINDLGQVLVDSGVGGGAYVWQNGITTNIDSGLYARAINNNGQVAGSLNIGSDARRAFIWQAGAMSYLHTLENSLGIGINNSGRVVGTYEISYIPGYGTVPLTAHAFIWSNGTMTDLGDSSNEAVAINDSGQVVGASSRHAFLWENGAMVDLGTLGGLDSYSTAINNSGLVVGYSSLSATGYRRAFLWQNQAMIDLGTLGGNHSEAQDINNRGLVVGSAYMPNKNQHAFLWENGEMMDLGTLGGSSSFARAINNNGWIVGKSTDSLGLDHAVIWQSVPEPSSVAVIFFGGSGLGRMVLRRRRR